MCTMKEECKLCVKGWCDGPQATTDFSISSLMRPALAQNQMEPRHELLLSLLKLGYYQPAGPLIKESGTEAERALARYHPPHYHPPHPTMLQQYGPPPYYASDLCYSGRYYRPPGPYHMSAPPQADSQMVGVSEPYPPQYYGAPPCYQHSPQRAYIEYRGCPCPMNACPKNVLIGPATGKAPAGGGPADVPSALAPPGGAFRAKVRVACAVDSGADAHGSGKDPPLEPEPPAAADAPRPCPLPAIGGASPKRELYDVRDSSGLRLVGDMSGPVEAVGPPSPARGSAGACAPQPPPVAPRRARLGKAMARRSLAGDDTGLLLNGPQPPPAHHNDTDDDVLAVSPPTCAPIDLSSPDEAERVSTPLVDVKKENEGPQFSPPRKTDAQALKEHNPTTADTENTNAAKAAKRRYSKPKMEIDLGNVELDDVCKTNGIGEHVKLQKRRKVSSEQHDFSSRTDTVTSKEVKKKSPAKKKTPKTSTTSNDKKNLKRKSDSTVEPSQTKKVNAETVTSEDTRQKNITSLVQETNPTRPKTKSALLLDNLIRKNSVDRPDAKGYSSDADIDPVELFLSPKDNVTQCCTKKTLNINNNVIDNNVNVNGVQPKTIELLDKKPAASKDILKPQKMESKVTHMKSLKSVLKTLTDKMKEDKPDTKDSDINKKTEELIKLKEQITDVKNEKVTEVQIDTALKVAETVKTTNEVQNNVELSDPKQVNDKIIENSVTAVIPEPPKKVTAQSKPVTAKRSKLSIDKLNKDKPKREKVEKVAKLSMVSKKSVFKTDEATLLIEDACASPITVQKTAVKRSRRRRSGARRVRKTLTLLEPPETDESRAPPKWNNGWRWEGHFYLSKVYLNNDTRQDRTARCYSRMRHESGDRVARGDCVLLRATSTRAQPFVARVARLWENPDDGEMMVSLVWYYRPEHTELGRQPEDAPDEVFASRHRDANSVACIEDKCFVLTFNEYCRYRKRLKAAEEGITMAPSIVPPMPAHEMTPALQTNDTKMALTISPELVLFCRKIYDFRSKKIQVPTK